MKALMHAKAASARTMSRRGSVMSDGGGDDLACHGSLANEVCYNNRFAINFIFAFPRTTT